LSDKDIKQELKKGNIVTIIQDSFVESECSDFMKL